MSLFHDKTDMPKRPDESESYNTFSPSQPHHQPPVGGSVHTTLSCAEDRALRMSNYPRYDIMDVHNVKRPRFGHGY